MPNCHRALSECPAWGCAMTWSADTFNHALWGRTCRLPGNPRNVPGMKRRAAIDDLIKVMAKLRSPKGCPWDREQNHKTLRWHAVEEVYELMDAIEAEDDHEL